MGKRAPGGTDSSRRLTTAALGRWVVSVAIAIIIIPIIVLVTAQGVQRSAELLAGFQLLLQLVRDELVLLQVARVVGRVPLLKIGFSDFAGSDADRVV